MPVFWALKGFCCAATAGGGENRNQQEERIGLSLAKREVPQIYLGPSRLPARRICTTGSVLAGNGRFPHLFEMGHPTFPNLTVPSTR
jgi:hypothetical protein